MTTADLMKRIVDGLSTRWMGGVAVVHNGTEFDAVPGAYLTDVSWSGRGKCVHVVTYRACDFLEGTEAEFEAELEGYLQRALERA